MTSVFDHALFEDTLRNRPVEAFRMLADAVQQGSCRTQLRNVMPIGGGLRDEFDTLRLSLDVQVRMVQEVTCQPVTERNGLADQAPRRRLRAGSVPAGE